MSRLSNHQSEDYGLPNIVCDIVGLHYSTYFSSINDNMKRVYQLEREKSQVEQTLQEQKRSVRDIKQQVDQLERENQKLERAVQERNTRVRNSQQQVDQLEKRNLQLELALQKRDKSVEDSKQQVYQFERENRQLKQALVAKDESIKNVQQQLTIIETENKELKRSKRDLQNRLDREGRNRNMFHSPDRLEFMLDRLNLEGIRQKPSNIEQTSCHNCRHNMNEISNLKGEVSHLSDRFKRTAELLEKSVKDTRQSREEIIHLKSNNDSYKYENEMLTNQATQLKKEIKLLLYKKRERPSDILLDPQNCHNSRNYRNQISDLKTEVSRQKPSDILLDLRSCHNCMDHRKEISDLKAEVSNLRHGQMPSDMDQESCWNYRNEIFNLNGQVSDLQDRLQQISKSRDAELQLHGKKMSSLQSEHKELTDKWKRKEELLKESENNARQSREEIIRLESDNVSYKIENEMLKNLEIQLKKDLQLFEEKIRRKPSDPQSCLNCRNYKKEISDLRTEVSSLQHVSKSKDEELRQQGTKMSRLLLDNKDLTEKWKRTEDLLKKSERNTRQSQEEIVHLKSDNFSYKNDNDKFQSQATQLQKEIQMLEENIRKKPSDILPDRHKSCQNCRNYSNEISDLKESVSGCKHTAELLEYSEKKIRQLQDEINDLKSDNLSYQKDIEELQNQKLQLKNEIQLLEGKLSHASSDLLLDSRNCQHCWIYRNEISDLKVEVNKLRDRLSEAAGNKLRDGNPNIADLSDMNRPTSLAEKFSSLYTDEYTDAMEVIEGTMDEQASVLFLLQLLQSCFDWSKKLAEEQRHLLSVESFGFMTKYLKQPSDFQLPDSCLIYVKEFQKKISADGNNLGAVEMICLEDGMKQANLKSNQIMRKYMKKCSLLCWMMQISDPPIYLNFDVKVGEKLDKNVYNVFTKSGSEIEFLVWPAMYIHRTGPMLAKGVAQGK